MMDLKLFGDRTYSLAIITIFAALFAAYGMLLVITQYMQNVRGFSPTDAGIAPLAVQHEPDDRVAEGWETRGSGRLAAADSPRPRVADRRVRRSDRGAAGEHGRRQSPASSSSAWEPGCA